MKNKSRKSDFRVLFVYYNPRKMSLVPPSIAIFSSLLKSINVEVALFDTTLYNEHEESDSDAIEEKNLTVKPFSDSLSKFNSKITYKLTDVYNDFENLVNKFCPDLLAATALESTFEGSIRLLGHVRHYHIPTVIGGVFPTFAPERVIACPEIDMVCVGEGEKVIVELVQKMREGKDYSQVPNLWVKQKDGRIIKNPLSPLVSFNDNPLVDMEIFEDARFYRAMGGRIYKMFPVETHRGCSYSCGFCNSPLQNKMYKEKTNQIFFRCKSIPKVHEEIGYYQKLGAEYLFFWADNLFLYSQREIDEFCERYSDFKLPFYCQAHPECLSIEKVEKLKAVGMQRIGIGIEHGNEDFRLKVLNRIYSNKMLVNKLKMLTELDIEYSVNNIIGFPDETPELVMDTVELNRQHTAVDISCSIFTPFIGTPLRKLALEKGYLKDEKLLSHSTVEASVLQMPQFTTEQILGKRRTFNMYIKFPKDRWKEISLAEEMSPRGDAVWGRLSAEYVSTYINSGLRK